MAKSKIIKELVNNEISLEIALKRIYVLASDLDNEQIKLWSEKELYGYSNEDVLPEYRVFHGCKLTYSGINGGYKVTNQPLSLTWLKTSTVERLSIQNIYDPLSEVEKFSKTEQGVCRDLSYLAGEVEHKTRDGWRDGVQCVKISQIIYPTEFARILSSVSSKALKILIELDKQFGCLDDLDIGSEKIGKKEKSVLFDTLNLIVTDNSTRKEKTVIKNSNVGDNNTIDKDTSVEVSPSVELNNGEKKKGFWSWFKRIFGKNN